jgi:hypothetical protein
MYFPSSRLQAAQFPNRSTGRAALLVLFSTALNRMNDAWLSCPFYLSFPKYLYGPNQCKHMLHGHASPSMVQKASYSLLQCVADFCLFNRWSLASLATSLSVLPSAQLLVRGPMVPYYVYSVCYVADAAPKNPIVM